MNENTGHRNLKDYHWNYEYRTSSLKEDKSPVDILHDFYIPVLQRSVSYWRVAGYFTSSSLAAASQGFSAFTASGGKMRLITGADLDADDVTAILEGEDARLARTLEQELVDSGWPDDVRRGVELLGWMVERGVLEVRVAFRVHGSKGDPLPVDSAVDGYVHEKWALFEDAFGNCIRVSGSLNESKTALVRNAENISLDLSWWNYPAPERIQTGKKDFETLWNNRHPHFKVLSLPEAVRARLLSIGRNAKRPLEIDGTSAAASPEPTRKEWLAFKAMKLAPSMPGGVWAGMETAPVEPWPHQKVVARRLVESWPAGYLLCDEVGLGKTIEAGLAFRSLILSKMAKRILIAAPASLTRQWHREMAEKFFLPFSLSVPGASVQHETIFPEKNVRKGAGLFEPDLCIISTGLLVRPERKDSLHQAPAFDVALVDEAHYARRKNPATQDSCRSWPEYGNLFKTVEHIAAKKTESLWLATATPVQLDWIEAFDLFSLLERGGAFQSSPSLVRFYYDILGQIIEGENLSKTEWALLRRAVERLRQEDPLYWEYLEKGIIHGYGKKLMNDWLQGVRDPIKSELQYIRRLLFAGAPLSRVMMRHSRELLSVYRKNGELKANLAARIILPLPGLSFSPEEKRIYDSLEDYCSELRKRIEQGLPEESRKISLGFYLSFLRQRFSSSFFALLRSLIRRRKKVEATLRCMGLSPEEESFDPEERDEENDFLDSVLENRSPEDLEWERGKLSELIEAITSLNEAPSKIKELLERLQARRSKGRIRQAVIFTRYLDTLNDIRNHLHQRDPKMRIGVFSGKYCAFFNPETARLENTDREDVKRRFLRGEIDVLLCTDAAAEGLNLQTADLLVNFDLPWNPMKVEQRIGRIDRIGQTHDEISVLNLCILGSVEEVIYGRLLKRLGEARSMVGSLPFSLLPLYEEEFSKYACGELDEDALLTIASERIEKQKSSISGMEMPAEDQYDFYRRLFEENRGEDHPVSLEQIWETLFSSSFLRALGCKPVDEAENKILELSGIPGIPEGTCLTTDRELFEKGFPGLRGKLHFATYGDPVFESVVDFVLGRIPDPSGIVEIECGEEFAHRNIRALAVRTPEGCRLVASLSEVAEISDVAESEIDTSELLSLLSQLKKMAGKCEGKLAAGWPPLREGIRTVNSIAASVEREVESVLALALLGSLSAIGMKEENPFWDSVAKLDQRWKEQEKAIVANVPLDILRQKKDEQTLFWDLKIPQAGQKADIPVPSALFKACVDRVCREAEAARKKKSSITIAMIKERLKRGLATKRNV